VYRFTPPPAPYRAWDMQFDIHLRTYRREYGSTGERCTRWLGLYLALALIKPILTVGEDQSSSPTEDRLIPGGELRVS